MSQVVYLRMSACYLFRMDMTELSNVQDKQGETDGI